MDDRIIDEHKTVDMLGIVRIDGFVSVKESIDEMTKQHEQERADRLYDALKDELYYQGKIKAFEE